MQNCDRPLYIAWDEYNVWYRARSGGALAGNNALEEHYNLEDALVISGFLNLYQIVVEIDYLQISFIRRAACKASRE